MGAAQHLSRPWVPQPNHDSHLLPPVPSHANGLCLQHTWSAWDFYFLYFLTSLLSKSQRPTQSVIKMAHAAHWEMGRNFPEWSSRFVAERSNRWHETPPSFRGTDDKASLEHCAVKCLPLMWWEMWTSENRTWWKQSDWRLSARSESLFTANILRLWINPAIYFLLRKNLWTGRKLTSGMNSL